MKKILKNKAKTVYGIKRRFYTVVVDLIPTHNKYFYFLNRPFTSNDGDQLIWRSKSKSRFLTRHTLPILSLIYFLFVILRFVLKWLVLIPTIIYLSGLYEFVFKRNYNNSSAICFNWANIVIVTILSTIWILVKLHLIY